MRKTEVLSLLSLGGFLWCCSGSGGPYQATGFKIGEVTDNSALIWTRLTLRPERNQPEAPMLEIVYQDGNETSGRRRKFLEARYPNAVTVADIRDAVPGTPGEVRILYRPANEHEWLSTSWQPVDPHRDFTHQFHLTKLEPDMGYEVQVESRLPGDRAPRQSLEGTFQTAPHPGLPGRVVFTVSTGQGYDSQDRPDGYNIYPEMLELNPSFFVHTGDIVYYDQLAKTVELARYHWQRTYSLPTNMEFHRRVPAYFIKDDHDTWMNDCWPGMRNDFMGEFTLEQGQRIFLEQVPMGPRTYRTYRWGKDLQIWLVEGRDFRSPNDMPDGPEKTIWGREQKGWFKRTVLASDATFRVLISPTPLVGPDRDNKHDNHSNRDFAYEGRELRQFIASQKNMVIVCGDRHWQYMSVDPETGVREYSCGPVSDKHAGGWKADDFRPQYHRYLQVIGGFLSATVELVDDKPTLTFRFHNAQGQVQFEDRLVAE